MSAERKDSGAADVGAKRPAESEPQMDEALEETFPASDAPAWSPLVIGGPHRDAAADKRHRGPRRT